MVAELIKLKNFEDWYLVAWVERLGLQGKRPTRNPNDNGPGVGRVPRFRVGKPFNKKNLISCIVGIEKFRIQD